MAEGTFGDRYCATADAMATPMRRSSRTPKKGITGHDEWVITEALATALVALEQLPPKRQPRPHMEDIRKLLNAGCQPGTANCISLRPSAGCFRAAIRPRSIGNTVSRMDWADIRAVTTGSAKMRLILGCGACRDEAESKRVLQMLSAAAPRGTQNATEIWQTVAAKVKYPREFPQAL